MSGSEFEVALLGVCCALDGRVIQVERGRRNGVPVAFFPAEWSSEVDRDDDGEQALLESVSGNLTAVERRTWLELVRGRSIRELALDEGVSRAAIYERIRGNGNGRGGMIAKNRYVALWWHQRSKRRTP